MHPLSLSSPCQTPRERQDLVQVELKGLVSSLGLWGPSCLPAYPLGVLREPSCAPGQLIILAHDFSSPPPPNISHILYREKASTGHVWLVLLCSISSSCHACSHLLHSALFVPISHVIEQVGRPMEGADLHHPQVFSTMPTPACLICSSSSLPVPIGLHLKSHGEGCPSPSSQP